jgi:hypothetical protein
VRSRTALVVLAGLLAVAAATTAIVVLARGEGQTRITSAPPAQGAGPCPAPPPGTEVAVPSGNIERDARVSVPGAEEIETHGFVVSAVADEGAGRTAAIVTDPRSDAADGLVGTIDGDELVGVTRVVEGCTVAALASSDQGTWTATCDPAAAPDQTTGAELVLVTDGGAGRRIPLPTSCIGTVAVAGERAWVTNVAVTTTPSRLWRVDLATGAVDEPVALSGSTVIGLAATSDALWTLRRNGEAASLVRTDAASGADTVSVPVANVHLAGIAAGQVWTTDAARNVLTAHDPTTGEPGTEVTVADLQRSATSSTTLWFERASRDALRITVGRVDDESPSTVVSFTGVGPDRSGLPFLATLSATERGAWLGYQNRLFLLPD